MNHNYYKRVSMSFYMLMLLFFPKWSAGFNTSIFNALSDLFIRPIVNVIEAPAFISLAGENGYRAERHEVVTEDGYVLAMHRIQPRENCARKKPVLLMHGLLQSSEDMVSAGPFAPGFVLAEQCYDVWCGNVRGNSNSRKHIILDPDKDLEFWKFSFDEMGLYDVPAMVDYVLEQTSSPKLIYIGFSQGGSTFFIMNSEKPEYAEKISLFVGLSPSARNFYTKSIVFRTFSKVIQTLRAELETFGVWEVLHKGSFLAGPLNFLCQNELVSSILCDTVTSLIDSSHPESVTPEIVQRIYNYFPAGTSVTNFEKYAQALENKKFVKMDYGPEKNKEVYGSFRPPKYNFGASNVPAVILHGLSDHMVDTKDVKWIVTKLPNVLDYIEVEDPLWNHLDMISSRFWNETIFTSIKNYMAQYDSI